MIYRLKAVHRAADGTITPSLSERSFDAANTPEAIQFARGVDLDTAALGANAVVLVDEAGTIVWSLRRADPNE